MAYFHIYTTHPSLSKFQNFSTSIYCTYQLPIHWHIIPYTATRKDLRVLNKRLNYQQRKMRGAVLESILYDANFNKSPLFLFFLDISKAFGSICSENSYGTSPSSFLHSSSSSLNSFPIATKHCKAHFTRTNVTRSYMKHVNLCNYNKGNRSTFSPLLSLWICQSFGPIY